ncbi:MAG: N-acetyltransferase [Cellvibrio sp.]|jgi:GNAT superfamily N-acetyltransferase|nr:N-acetyltransferase [Cellvibrio sp.]
MSVIDPVIPRAFDKPCKFQRIEPVRFALVDRFYRTQGYKVKAGAGERIYAIAGEGGSFIAAARLVPQTSGHYWLRNLLVVAEWRGRGIATGLMCSLLPDLAPRGCYCFALPHLNNFYRGLGFTQNPPHCPDDILRTYNTYRTRGRDWVLMGYIQD